MSHSDVLKVKLLEAVNIGDDTGAVYDTVTNNILKFAAQRMEAELGTTGWADYVNLIDTITYTDDEEYYKLTSDQKRLNDLEGAEALFIAYYLVPALKQLKDNTVTEEAIPVGLEGREILPSTIDAIIENRKMYEIDALALIANSTTTYATQVTVI
jgi:hypothetical protein